jgi:hypothetical protein
VRTSLVRGNSKRLDVRIGALEAPRQLHGALTVDAGPYHLDGVRRIVQVDHRGHELTEMHLPLHRRCLDLTDRAAQLAAKKKQGCFQMHEQK